MILFAGTNHQTQSNKGCKVFPKRQSRSNKSLAPTTATVPR